MLTLDTTTAVVNMVTVQDIHSLVSVIENVMLVGTAVMVLKMFALKVYYRDMLL